MKYFIFSLRIYNLMKYLCFTFFFLFSYNLYAYNIQEALDYCNAHFAPYSAYHSYDGICIETGNTCLSQSGYVYWWQGVYRLQPELGSLFAVSVSCSSLFECPDSTYADDQSQCPLCPDGITPIPSGGINACPCKFPYGKKDSSGECIVFCQPGSLPPDCSPVKNQAEAPKMCVANPIDVSSGEKIQYESPDYQGNGPLALVFKRNYQSNRTPESDYWLENGQITSLSASREGWIRYVQPDDYQGISSGLIALSWETDSTGVLQVPLAGQKQWMHNYQISLKNTSDELIRTSGQGELGFTNTGGGLYNSLHVTPLSIVASTLPDGNAGFIYQKKPRLAEYFNSDGQLIRIEQSETVYQDLSYNTDGKLITVNHSLGGVLHLSYNDSGQLSQLLTPDNTTVSYLYDAVGNLSLVTKTFGDGQSSSRSHHYEHANLPYALTGITDEAGVRVVSWTYNELGQATQSVHAGGADDTTLSYQGENSTTVTNALGKTTTYQYQNLNGVKRLTSVEGQASTNCAGANKTYNYYDNGQLQSKTDWLGNTTTYTYNAKHQQISETEAVGTPLERTTTTVWHATLNLPIQVTSPNQIMDYSYDAQGNLLSKTSHPTNAAQGE